MPNPRANENREDFLSRCMGSAEANADFPDNDQRYAFCNSVWDQSRKGQEDMIDYKSATFELKKLPDEDGVFEGYASVFGIIDEGNDVVQQGAFRESISKRMPKLLWQHDREKIIGVFEEIREDDSGLFVRGRLLKDLQLAREAMTLMKAGALDSMSIGYRTIDADYEGQDGMVRKLNKVDLYEISLVTFPMLSAAKITSVKAIETERDFEKFLRDAGYSKKQATAIALHGFKAINRRDADAENQNLKDLLNSLTNLKETIK